MKPNFVCRIAIASLCLFALGANAAPDFGQMVKDFSARRHALAQDLSTRLNLPLPPEAEAFFQAAATGPWDAVSNAIAALRPQSAQTTHSGLVNELWAPIHEAWGAWEVWHGWQENSELLALFYEPVMASMPAGSIYFGGTDSGRFVITAANELRDPPPVLCLTQNALADNTYMAHLRAVCGDRIWLPSEQDMNASFKQFVDDVKAGRILAGADIKIEDGRVRVQGVGGVMQINALLARMIFDRNKDTHPLFIEESYVLAWMAPYLEPHGPILKLNPEPLETLPRESIDRDTQFWAEQEKTLMATPGFAENYAARKSFSKLRAAIAGVYEYRKLYPEAEAAYRQASRLCPTAPETHLRLAQMLADQQRRDDAIRVLEDFIAADPAEGADSAKEFRSNLRKAKQPNETDKEQTPRFSGSPAIET